MSGFELGGFELAKLVLEALAGQYGAALQVISWIAMVMGSVRIVMKPVMVCLKAIAAATETKKDDELIEKVETSKAYVTISFIIDWFLSVKLPEKKPVEPSPVVEPSKVK